MAMNEPIPQYDSVEQALTVESLTHVMFMSNTKPAEYSLHAHVLSTRIDLSPAEILQAAWEGCGRLVVHQPTAIDPYALLARMLANKVAAATRRSTANIIVVQNAEVMTRIHQIEPRFEYVIDPTIKPNEVRALLSMPSVMFDARDCPYQFTSSGNYANVEAMCGTDGYFARGDVV